MTAPTAARPSPTTVVPTAWRGVLRLSVAALVLSVVLLPVLRTSTNPAPGSFVFDAVAWVQDVATLTGAVLLGAALVLRQTGRG